jgi:hypothetical protein
VTAHALIHALAGHGIPWSQILLWLEQYGFPLVLQIIAMIPAGKINGLTVSQIIAWVSAALAAAQGKQPIPPLPTP